MEEIIESFINGNKMQMVKQIKKFGIYDFANKIEQTEELDDEYKLNILCCFLRLTNR